MARPSRLDDPGVREAVAELYAAGASRQEMVDQLPCGHVDTITVWVHDPKVQALVEKLIRERSQRIARKLDSSIEKRLDNVETIDTETLLKIRREYIGSTININNESDRAALIEELWLEAEGNPDLAQALAGLKS